MYYVYVLSSAKENRLYIGKTKDLKKRFEQHTKGQVKSTQFYRPWELVYYEAYLSNIDASHREIKLKMHAAKENLKLQIKDSLEKLLKC